jgi:hypothetical protein
MWLDFDAAMAAIRQERGREVRIEHRPCTAATTGTGNCSILVEHGQVPVEDRPQLALAPACPRQEVATEAEVGPVGPQQHGPCLALTDSVQSLGEVVHELHVEAVLGRIP